MTALSRLASLPLPKASSTPGNTEPGPPKFATSTLIRLYLAQGHVDKAYALAQRLCAEDPLDGQALALLTRCEQSLACSLHSRVSQGRLILRWDLKTRLSIRQGAFVHLQLIDASAKRAEPELRHISCDVVKGKRIIPLSFTQGACVSYLALQTKPGDPRSNAPRILAVGAVHRWRHNKELCRTRM